MTKNAATATAESRALAVITASGSAELQSQAIFLAIEPLARRAYMAGNDREQWENKPTEKRPIRPFWATLYAAKGVKKDGTPKWVDNRKHLRAMRAAASAVLAAMNDKARDKTDEGLELFMLSLETIIAGIIAPAHTAKTEADKAKTEADKADKAIRAILILMDDHLLTEAHIKVLEGIVTRAKTSTAKTSTAKTSTAKTSTAKTSTAKTSTAKTSTAKTSTAKTSTAKDPFTGLPAYVSKVTSIPL